MSPICTVTEVFDAIQQAKAEASAFCANFFPGQQKLEGWIAHNELFAEFRDGVVFFFRKDRDFWHLYFCASNMASLRHEIAALPCLKTEMVTVDLVGNKAAVGELLSPFESEEFRCYTRLYRMARTNINVSQQSAAAAAKVIYADKTDCPAIFDLLCHSFNRYAEQLPMLYEIESAVERRQILVVKSGRSLAGLLFFETQGFTSTIRYWLVVEQFRALRLGSALMQYYFASQKTVRRFVLWVISDNANAIEKYRHYGFTPDGLVDHVLVNKTVRL